MVDRTEMMRGRARPAGTAGFTLVEIMVSALVLAIGMMAALAMQYAALGGVMGSQDLTNATELSERVLQVAKHEAQQWRSRNASVSSIEAIYQTTDTPWRDGNTPILPSVNNNTWTWLPVTTQPVDVRLTYAGRRRYCVYVRGGPADFGGVLAGRNIFKLQIAVVYPGGNQVFPGANSNNAPVGTCTGLDVSGDYLEPPTPGGDLPDDYYQLDGYRAVFSGTIITDRTYLGPQVLGNQGSG